MKERNKKIAVFPGSFDPPTVGHMDIIKRGAELFDQLHVVVGVSLNKVGWLTNQERVKNLQKLCLLGELSNVCVTSFQGLTIDYAKKVGAKILVRGIRSANDLTYEQTMAEMNRQLYSGLETVFLLSKPEHIHVSSSMVKDVAKHSGDISSLVPELVEKSLTNSTQL